MAKNIPITARVSKGLFGQKATEPVLNVGQAGAYGNNVTKSDPSPARMMKSPLKQMKSEGAGDKILKGQANVVTTTPGTDRVIPGKKGGTANTDALNKQKVYRKDLEGYGLRNPKAREAANKAAADAKAKDAASGTPDTIEKGEPTKTREPLMVFNEGSAKTSFWRRQDDRAVTHTSRKKKRADIQLSKIEAEEKGLSGKERRDYINNAKTKAKKEMWESRQAGYQGSRDASVKQSQQSATIHDKVLGVNLDPKGEQILHASRVKDEAAAILQGKAREGFETKTTNTKENPAASKQTTTKPEMSQTTTKDVKMAEKDNGVSKVTEKDLEDDKPMVESATKKSANGFFVKKSPLKMKYFK
jgi:hypothetical protein